MGETDTGAGIRSLRKGNCSTSTSAAEGQKAREILAQHTDKEWTLCEAISFAVLELRHIKRAFTFDHQFREYGRIQVLELTA